jgi:hypothetical protein
VPSECYNIEGRRIKTIELDQYDGWQPERFLFETDLINYDDTDVANTSVITCADILEPQICVSVAPNGLNFGSLYPGECNDTLDANPSALVVTNCGGINTTVTVIVSGTLYTGNIWLSHGTGWIPAEQWSCDINAWQGRTINVKLCVPVPFPAGTTTGSISFVATPIIP